VIVALFTVGETGGGVHGAGAPVSAPPALNAINTPARPESNTMPIARITVW
jgi:hypothetical protein